MLDTEAFREFKQGLTLLRDNYAIRALPHMQKAMDLDKNNPYYMSYLGVVLARSERKWGEAERLCEVHEMHEGKRVAKDLVTFLRSGGPDVADTVVIDVRRDLAREVFLIVDDARDHQTPLGAARHLDRLGDALIRMDPPEENEIFAGGGPRRELPEVDPVIDRRRIRERRMTIGVADRDVRDLPVVALVDGEDLLRAEAVDRRDERDARQPAVREWQEIVVVVDEVDAERGRALVGIRDVQALPDFGIERRVLVERARRVRARPAQAQHLWRGENVEGLR